MYHSLDVLVGLTQFKDRIIKSSRTFLSLNIITFNFFSISKKSQFENPPLFLMYSPRSNTITFIIDYYKFVYATIFFVKLVVCPT
jgi:hypothetical protein